AYGDPDGPEARRELMAVESELNQRWPETKIEPSLTRISALTQLLGEPNRGYPVLHVAGTNGKGSTARMIDALLTRMGLRVGRYERRGRRRRRHHADRPRPRRVPGSRRGERGARKGGHHQARLGRGDRRTGSRSAEGAAGPRGRGRRRGGPCRQRVRRAGE